MFTYEVTLTVVVESDTAPTDPQIRTKLTDDVRDYLSSRSSIEVTDFNDVTADHTA